MRLSVEAQVRTPTLSIGEHQVHRKIETAADNMPRDLR
jgi:hypothetical protein